MLLACWFASAAPSAGEWPGERIALEKPPTSIVVSRDGRTLFIGLDRRFGSDGGIAAYRRGAGTFKKISESGVPNGVLGLALASDERTIVASTPVGLVAVDTSALLRGDPLMTAVRDGDAPGTNQLVISRDDRYVFYTNARAANLGVAQLGSQGSSGGAPSLTIVGHVALDRVPGGLALSHDGRDVFVTSEIDNVDPASLPGAGDARLNRTRCDVNLGPSGVLTIVSVEAAIRDPARAVLARSAAGCAPTRVALSAGDDVAWVSDRGESRVLAFDVARLRNKTDALLGSATVGKFPIGLAVSSDGRHVLVANAGHSSLSESRECGTLSVMDVDTVVHGGGGSPQELPADALPREVVAASHDTYFVTNYDGRSIDVVTPEYEASPQRNPQPSPSQGVPPPDHAIRPPLDGSRSAFRTNYDRSHFPTRRP